MTKQKELIGHSGCKLFLDNSSKSVIKVSSDQNYNGRLTIQMEKQRFFKHDILKTPAIYEYGVNDEGLFQFRMDYVNGIKFSDYVLNNPTYKSIEILNRIYTFIKGNIKDSVSSGNKSVLKKLNELENNGVNPDLIFSLRNLLKDSEFPGGYCHGDLTLENIIIFDEKIYLIDFLDSYIDSPFQDVSKLFQDFYFLWSFRTKPSNINAHIRCKALGSFMYSKFNANDLKSIDILAAINLLRIVPYSDNNNLIGQLYKKSNEIIEKWK